MFEDQKQHHGVRCVGLLPSLIICLAGSKQASKFQDKLRCGFIWLPIWCKLFLNS